MPSLSIHLLGSFQASLADQPITTFESNKVRALMAYLACESRQTHLRERLAGLLWLDWPQVSAMRNLRHALSNLRTTIKDRTAQPPFLLISRTSLSWNTESDAWVDVAEFERLAANPNATQADLEASMRCWRGAFLEDFSLSDSPAFEEWVLAKRQYYSRRFLEALSSLGDKYRQAGELELALDCARRQLALEAWHEPAYQRLMQLLDLQGQRVEALAQFERLRHTLHDELDIEPSPETYQLYDQIRLGSLSPPPAHIPAFLASKTPRPDVRPLFVARLTELERLHTALDQAVGGTGAIRLVTGSPGRGKSMLIGEFVRQAVARHPYLLVASGSCQAYFGRGDPYLPFREILATLTGDMESRWLAGTISQQLATRLWDGIPQTTQALVEHGPALIETIVPGTPLLDRARQVTQGQPSWLKRLAEIVAVRQKAAGAAHANQESLYSQYKQALFAMARNQPLLLVLDDLQWADEGSLGLLFSLSRQLEGAGILVVGAYRPEEAVTTSAGAPHPLSLLVQELQLKYGEIRLPLEEADERLFLEAFLDSQPNRLSTAFRQQLFQLTYGHPLYTVELLRGMQARGELVQNPAGEWVEAGQTNWDVLPARVEAAIGERLKRLPPDQLELLQAASVQGEGFIVQVLADTLGTDPQLLQRQLSQELDERHHLVQAERLERLDGQRLSHYRFRHILIQRYLYLGLDPVMRLTLHEAVAAALVRLYAGHEDEILTRLASHYEEADLTEQAVDTLYLAGKRATRLYAHVEAQDYFRRALALIPENDPAAHFKVLLAQVKMLLRTGSFDQAFEHLLILENLAKHLGSRELAQAANQKAMCYVRFENFMEGSTPAQDGVRFAQQAGDHALEAEAYLSWAICEHSLDAWENALALSRQVGDLDLQAEVLRHYSFAAGRDNDLVDMKIIEYAQQAIDLCQQTGNRYTEGRAWNMIALIIGLLDPARAIPFSQRSLQLCREVGNRWDELWALILLVKYYVFLGYRLSEAQNFACKTIEIIEGIHFNNEFRIELFFLLSEIYRLQGNLDLVILWTEKTIALINESETGFEGAWLKKCGDHFAESGMWDQAEQCYLRAIEIMPKEDAWIEDHDSAHIALGRLCLWRGQPVKALEWLASLSAFPIRYEDEAFPIRYGGEAYLIRNKGAWYLNYFLLQDYLICYQILLANQDPRAAQVLEDAHSILQQRAALIQDAEMRNSYLNNLPWNAEIRRLWEASHAT